MGRRRRSSFTKAVIRQRDENLIRQLVEDAREEA